MNASDLIVLNLATSWATWIRASMDGLVRSGIVYLLVAFNFGLEQRSGELIHTDLWSIGNMLQAGLKSLIHWKHVAKS